MNVSLTVPASLARLAEAVDFIRSNLSARKRIPSRKRTLTAMLAEDILSDMIAHAAENSSLEIRITDRLGVCRVKLGYVGSGFALSAKHYGVDASETADADVVQDMLRKAFSGQVEFHESRHGGTAVLTVTGTEYAQLQHTLLALALGLAAGFLLRALPGNITDQLTALCKGCQTMFLSSIKMIVGPLVLCSIAASIAGFSDIKALEKIGLRVFGMYLFTSFLALLVGLGVYTAFPIRGSFQASTAGAESIIQTAQSFSVSLLDTVVGIVPDNPVKMLLDTNMLQIIFFAILLGVSISLSGQYRQGAVYALEGLNTIFSRMTGLIVRFMPAAVFCSIAILTVSTGASTLLSLLRWLGLLYLAYVGMLVVYSVLLLVRGRISPRLFFRAVSPVMITAFTLRSSNATLPTTMDTAEKRLGIDRRLYSFSLPLGATINMDGNCITLIITALFMARSYDLPITSSVLFGLIISIMTLSIGAPGVPNGCLVCIAFLLPQLGLPLESVGIIVPLYALVEPMQTVINCTGDTVVSTIVAKAESMLDLSVLSGQYKQ